MITFRDFYNRIFNNGTYIKMTYDNYSRQKLYNWMIESNIPNCVDFTEIHTTLLQTNKEMDSYIPNYKLKGCVVRPERLEVWHTSWGTYCLVLILDSDELKEHHRNLIKNYKAIHKHKEFIPHITLSYDVGINYNVNNLLLPDFNLVINNEIISSLISDDQLKRKLLKGK